MGRAYCYRCQRVEASCICQQAILIDNKVSVYVLQHPDETRHSKGTAIIASLCLQHYQCWQGEDFSQHKQLNSLLQAEKGSVYILYPSQDAIDINECISTDAGAIKHLIVIDATWRKAKKIWALSKNLHDLPALTFNKKYISNYRIRKVPDDGYLSTLEAISCCLGEIEIQPEKYQPMLSLFDSVIDRQIEAMGNDVYEKNYKSE